MTIFQMGHHVQICLIFNFEYIFRASIFEESLNWMNSGWIFTFLDMYKLGAHFGANYKWQKSWISKIVVLFQNFSMDCGSKICSHSINFALAEKFSNFCFLEAF